VADIPNDWMSYADYLGLNEASLRELEDAAAQQGAVANEQASNALGRSYQEAQRDVEAGGQGNLTGTASYGDYLKAQRAAQQANAVRGSGYEGAARAAMSAGRQQPSFTGQRDVMQGQLDQRRANIATGKANVVAWNKDQKTANDAQDKAFETAKAPVAARLQADRKIAYYGDTTKGDPAAIARDRGYRGAVDWQKDNDRMVRVVANAGKRPGG